MPTPYKKLILDYCTKQSIAVPVGFGRNTPGRYIVIRTDQSPPKLVATTWRKQEDVVYYFEHFLVPQIGGDLAGTMHIMDFKEAKALRYLNSSRLAKIGDVVTGSQ